VGIVIGHWSLVICKGCGQKGTGNGEQATGERDTEFSSIATAIAVRTHHLCSRDAPWRVSTMVLFTDNSAEFSLDRGLKPLPIPYSLFPLPTTRLIQQTLIINFYGFYLYWLVASKICSSLKFDNNFL